MNIKGIIITAITIGTLLLSSCGGHYSCPTYAQDENKTILVKEISFESEIKL